MAGRGCVPGCPMGRGWVHMPGTADVRVGVLGPVEVRVRGEPVRLSPQQRVVLALLVLDRGRPVSTARLVEGLWGEGPPVSAVARIQSLVHQLRTILGPGPDNAPVIETAGDGYRARAEIVADLAAFEEHVRQARALLERGCQADAARDFERALVLWRGRPFGGACSDLLDAAAVRLEETHALVFRERAAALLADGRHAGLVPELSAAVAADPLCESLRALLMSALDGSGRRADALALYRESRELMRAELGVEPGEELRRAHAAVLAGDRAPGEVARAGRSATVPAQLPAGIADLTGRASQAAGLCRALTGGAGTSVPIAAVVGPGGAGKTALAVHAAHALAERFPDGQLYVDLRGTDATPMSPARALSRFVQALGVEARQVPAGLTERAALFRSRIARRRILVVLDNAAGEAQIRPLLPGSPGCAVLVTARTGLAGLESAYYVELGMFSSEQAVELLERIVGRDRVRAETGEAAEIARLCGHLPLAVRIAGARLRTQPWLTLSALRARLADERRRLDELAVGDLAVRATVASSYRALDEAGRRAMRRLTLLDVRDCTAWIVATVLHTDVRTAERVAESLAQAHLLEPAGSEPAGRPRYRAHDLVRAFCAEQAALDPEPDRRETVRRVLGAWLALAETADAALPYVYLTRIRGTAAIEVDPAVRAAIAADPAGWFAAERTRLLAAVNQAVSCGFGDLAWQLIAATATFRNTMEYFTDEWTDLHRATLGLCREQGDRLGAAVTLRGLADCALSAEADYAAGLCHAEEALSEFRVLGHAEGVADVLAQAGHARRCLGEYEKAAELADSAARLAGEHDANVLAFAHELRGVIRFEQGRFTEAEVAVSSLIAVATVRDDPLWLTYARRLLGTIRRQQGRTAEAFALFEHAFSGARNLGCRPLQLLCALSVAEVRTEQRDSRALPLARRAQAMAEVMGHQYGRAAATRLAGEALLDTGDAAAAITELREALRLARGVALPANLARTLEKLGDALSAAGRPVQARPSWHEARELLLRIGNHDRARQVAARVAALSSDSTEFA
jgi:DNA-binding SARP family transcriptional activator